MMSCPPSTWTFCGSDYNMVAIVSTSGWGWGVGVLASAEKRAPVALLKDLQGQLVFFSIGFLNLYPVLLK